MAFTAALDSTYATDEQLYQLYQATASLQQFSSSIQSEVDDIKAWTASLELINTIDTELLQILQTTASLNSKTGSYATTGSNEFVGNQTITGSLNVSGSANLTGSIIINELTYPTSNFADGQYGVEVPTLDTNNVFTMEVTKNHL